MTAEQFYVVATRFRYGKDASKDHVAAFKLYLGAASLSGRSRLVDHHDPQMFRGSPTVRCNLADQHENGLGVSRALDEALPWYRRSAEKNKRIAEFSLGKMYPNVFGVPRDPKLVTDWFDRASEHGSARAHVESAKSASVKY